MNLENNKTELKLDNAFDHTEFTNTTTQFATTDDLNIDFDEFQSLDPSHNSYDLDYDISLANPCSDYIPYSNPVQESYRQSEKDAQLPFWEILYKRFCKQYWGTSNVNVEYVSYNSNPGWQRRGIDRIIKFANGKYLRIEEKYVKGDHDKMFVEVFDDSDILNNNLGWFYTLDPSNTNYIVYGYERTKKFYFIPLKAFQEVFSLIFQGPHLYYEDDKVRATGNRTIGILVPWNEIQSKIKGVVCIQL